MTGSGTNAPCAGSWQVLNSLSQPRPCPTPGRCALGVCVRADCTREKIERDCRRLRTRNNARQYDPTRDSRAENSERNTVSAKRATVRTHSAVSLRWQCSRKGPKGRCGTAPIIRREIVGVLGQPPHRLVALIHRADEEGTTMSPTRIFRHPLIQERLPKATPRG